jgi:hypothetical protein
VVRARAAGAEARRIAVDIAKLGWFDPSGQSWENSIDLTQCDLTDDPYWMQYMAEEQMRNLRAQEIAQGVLDGLMKGAKRYVKWTGENVGYKGTERVLQVSVVEELSRRQKQHDRNAAITFEVAKADLREHTKGIGRNDTPDLSTEELQFGPVDIGIWNGGNYDEGKQKIYGLVELKPDWKIDKCLEQDLTKLRRLLAARNVSAHGTLETIAVGAYYEFYYPQFAELSEPKARESIEAGFWKWWDNARALNIGIRPVVTFGKPGRIFHKKQGWI